MSGNYAEDATRGKVYNAVYGSGTPVITFDTTGGGAWVINDNMENGNYILTGDDTIDADTGTTTQYVAINNDLVNAADVQVEIPLCVSALISTTTKRRRTGMAKARLLPR